MNSALTSYQQKDTWVALGILREVRFKTTTSGGKGGQHVNKVSSRVELYWKPAESYLISEEAKEKILQKLAKKLSQEGELRIVSDEDRSQLRNKEKAIEKFYQLVTSCFKEAKKRKATKPTKASVKKRLEDKSKRKDIKSGRGKLKF